eukprot:211536_1
MDLASGTWNESEEGPVITEIESDEHDSESSSDDDQDTPISQMLQNNDNKNKSVEPSESEEEVETEMETNTPLHDTVNLTGEESGDDTMHENVNHQQNGFNMKSEDGVDLNPTHHTSKHASQTVANENEITNKTVVNETTTSHNQTVANEITSQFEFNMRNASDVNINRQPAPPPNFGNVTLKEAPSAWNVGGYHYPKQFIWTPRRDNTTQKIFVNPDALKKHARTGKATSQDVSAVWFLIQSKLIWLYGNAKSQTASAGFLRAIRTCAEAFTAACVYEQRSKTVTTLELNHYDIVQWLNEAESPFESGLSKTRLKTYTQRLKSFAYENEIEAVTWPPPKPQTTAARNTKSTTQDNEINRIPKKKQTTRITYKTRANEKSEMDTDPKKQTHSNVKVDIFTMMQRLKPNKYVLGDTQSLARYERRFDRMMDRIVNAKREMMRKAKEFDTALTPNGAEALCNIYTDDAFSELTDFRAYFHLLPSPLKYQRLLPLTNSETHLNAIVDTRYKREFKALHQKGFILSDGTRPKSLQQLDTVNRYMVGGDGCIRLKKEELQRKKKVRFTEADKWQKISKRMREADDHYVAPKRQKLPQTGAHLSYQTRSNTGANMPSNTATNSGSNATPSNQIQTPLRRQIPTPVPPQHPPSLHPQNRTTLRPQQHPSSSRPPTTTHDANHDETLRNQSAILTSITALQQQNRQSRENHTAIMSQINLLNQRLCPNSPQLTRESILDSEGRGTQTFSSQYRNQVVHKSAEGFSVMADYVTNEKSLGEDEQELMRWTNLRTKSTGRNLVNDIQDIDSTASNTGDEESKQAASTKTIKSLTRTKKQQHAQWMLILFICRVANTRLTDIMAPLIKFTMRDITSRYKVLVPDLFKSTAYFDELCEIVLEILAKWNVIIVSDRNIILDLLQKASDEDETRRITSRRGHTTLKPAIEIDCFSQMLNIAILDWSELRLAMNTFIRARKCSASLFWKLFNRIGSKAVKNNTKVLAELHTPENNTWFTMLCAQEKSTTNHTKLDAVNAADELCDDFKRADYLQKQVQEQKYKMICQPFGQPPNVGHPFFNAHATVNPPPTKAPKNKRREKRNELKKRRNDWLQLVQQSVKTQFASIKDVCANHHASRLKCFNNKISDTQCTTSYKVQGKLVEFKRSHLCLCGQNHSVEKCETIWQDKSPFK